MSGIKWKLEIDWSSKIIDLLIVIIGITIAFELNNLSESKKTQVKEQDYLNSFYEENIKNETGLSSALKFTNNNKRDIDTLKQLLLSKKYTDERIQVLTAGMMGLSSFAPTITTMENITASSEFELLIDVKLRRDLIDTYKGYITIKKHEEILENYVSKYVTPFFFKNVRFSDFSSISTNYIEDHIFENIVFGYQVLLNQQILGYQEILEQIKMLDEILISRNKGK